MLGECGAHRSGKIKIRSDSVIVVRQRIVACSSCIIVYTCVYRCVVFVQHVPKFKTMQNHNQQRARASVQQNDPTQHRSCKTKDEVVSTFY